MKSSLVDLAVSGSGMCLASSMIYVFGPGADPIEGAVLVLAVIAGAAFSCFAVGALRHLPSNLSDILRDEALGELRSIAIASWKKIHDLSRVVALRAGRAAGRAGASAEAAGTDVRTIV